MGSSRTRSSGEGASAIARSTWPFCPFDSRPNGVFGGTPKRSSRRDTEAESHDAEIRLQKSAICSAVIAGGASGSSGTTPTRARNLARCLHVSAEKIRA